MVLSGNIGEFSLVLRRPGAGRSLQTRPMTDDDDAFGLSSAGPELIRCPKPVPARKGKYEANNL